jgi:hypothetical protein
MEWVSLPFESGSPQRDPLRVTTGTTVLFAAVLVEGFARSRTSVLGSTGDESVSGTVVLSGVRVISPVEY